MRKLLIVASLFILAVPAALAVPPSDKGKPDKVNASAAAPGQSAEKNAAKACKAERAKDPAAFAAKYGTNANKRNAFGKCVSAMAKAKAKKTDAEDEAADDAAAKKCKAERAKDPAAFATKYGTSKNKKNAFGKCISKLSKSDEDDD